MWYDEKIKEYADISKNINKKFADINGYDFFSSDKILLKGRDPTWEKIPLLLNSMNKKYEYVIWIDADACFKLDMENKLESIINKNREKYFILSEDIDDRIINAGFMIIKNGKYSRNILRKIINSRLPECRKYTSVFHEQDCLSHLYIKNFYELRNNTVILPFGELQSFSLDNHVGAQVLHLAGKTNDDITNHVLEKKHVGPDYTFLSITGPEAVGVSLNHFMERNETEAHKNGYYKDYYLHFMVHENNGINDNGYRMMNNKYENWQRDRKESKHYSDLFHENNIYK